jgi:hypothetical protein
MTEPDGDEQDPTQIRLRALSLLSQASQGGEDDDLPSYSNHSNHSSDSEEDEENSDEDEDEEEQSYDELDDLVASVRELSSSLEVEQGHGRRRHAQEMVEQESSTKSFCRVVIACVLILAIYWALYIWSSS